MKNFTIGSGIILALMTLHLPALAAEEGLTKSQGRAIIRQLGNIQRLLGQIEKKLDSQARVPPLRRSRRPAANVKVSISTKGRPALGRSDAPLTLVEFTDYQCPYCNRFFKNTFPQLKKNFIDTGKLRLVVKDLPLAFHRNARPAAQAAHCAGDQKKFWPMHDKLYENGKRLNPENLPGYAKELALDVSAFKECIAQKSHLTAIDKDEKEARAAGITGTPTFVLGKTRKDIIDGVKIRGARPYRIFATEILKLLKSAKVKSK